MASEQIHRFSSDDPVRLKFAFQQKTAPSSRFPEFVGRTRWTGRWSWALILLAMLAFSGCAANPNATNQIFPLMGSDAPPGIQALPTSEGNGSTSESGVVSAAEGQAAEQTTIEIPTPTPIPDVTVTVRNRSVNIRSGPGLDFPVIFGARQGAEFKAIGRNGDSSWWLICCIPGPGDKEGEPTQTAWISNVVVEVSGEGEKLSVVGELLPADLTAEWSVSYECSSDRCVVPVCDGAMTASVRNADDKRWLEVERKVEWTDNCGEQATWIHQLDRFTGNERFANSTDLFLFNYWMGAAVGEANSVFTLPNGQQVLAWCSGPQSAEVEEADGWTTVYEGENCYDVRTGMLVSMQYSKQWLFTGTYEGKEYDRAFFGDVENYTVQLSETNLELATVDSSGQ